MANTAKHLADSGAISPWLSGQLANLIFVGTGGALMAWVNRRGAS
jgi:hypothetical protein